MSISINFIQQLGFISLKNIFNFYGKVKTEISLKNYCDK